MKTKTIYTALVVGLTVLVLGAASFNLNKTEPSTKAIAATEEITTPVSKTVNFHTNIATYGSAWGTSMSGSWYGNYPAQYFTEVVNSNEIDETLIDSTFTITANTEGGGICYANGSVIGVRNANINWQLND